MKTAILSSTAICAAHTANAQDFDYANTDAQVINEQIDLNADIRVVSESKARVTAAATAQAAGFGNTAAVDTTFVDTAVDSLQAFDGQLRSHARTEAEGAGVLVSNSAAFANTLTAQSEAADLGVRAEQTVSGDSAVASRAEVKVRPGGGADVGVASAQAAANSIGLTPAHDSELESYTRQTSGADVTAVGDVDARGAANWTGTASGTAVGNDLSAIGGQSTIRPVAEQNNSGDVAGRAQIRADVASEAVAASQSAGNNLLVANDQRYADLEAVQTNSGGVSARSNVALEGFGLASVTASGVGNSSVVSNIGSAVRSRVDQRNSGDVTVSGSFSGGAGSAGLVTTTAFGNAQSSYVCSECRTARAEGGTRQVNSGAVTARSTASAYQSDLLSSSATAVGNTSTYSVQNPNGGGY